MKLGSELSLQSVAAALELARWLPQYLYVPHAVCQT